MADPSKSQPGWSFTNTSTAGSTSNLLAQPSTNTSNAPTSSLFGAGSNTPASSAPSYFGGTSTTNQGSSLFGGGDTGGASNQNQGSSIFGGGNAGGGNTFGAPSPSSGAGFNFGSKKDEQPVKSPAATGFGGANNTGSNSLFGNISSPTSSSAPFGALTPTSKPAGGQSFFGNPSTTPAGPPPSNPLSFSTQKPHDQTSNPFGSLGQPKSTASEKPSTAAPPSLFGEAKPSGSLFQNSQPSDANAKITTSQPTTSIFANAASNNLSSNIFGNKPESQPTAGLFNNLPNLNNAKSPTTPATSEAQQSKAEAPKPMFPSLGGQSAAANSDSKTSGLSMFPSTSQPADASKPAFSLLSPTSKPAESSTNATATSSLFNPAKASTGASASSAPTAPSNMFGSFGKVAEKQTDSTTGTAVTSAPSLAAAAPLTSDTKPTTSTMPPPATKPSEPTSSSSANAPLGASTTGPAPTSQSRLKNKSMDEIITRWASDLLKYQKEFQRQAEKVAEWDRMLVENSDKIQKLYGNTLEAQRATAEVERQITVVENEQDELEYYLNVYEAQVDEMWKAQGGETGEMKGPDKERQDTYDLAERLTERLDEMGKDLTSMIEEINDASSSLNKNSKPDDPLSQVVRVLNSHLVQLQQIDQGAAALQMKVAAAAKASQGFGASNGYNGPSSDAADGFYRSFMGRR